MKTIEAAAGKWKGILKGFGLPEEFLKNRHGKCPLCGGVDRYRFDDKDGTGSYFCSGCGPGYGLQLLARWTKKDTKTILREIDALVGNIQPEAPKKPTTNRVMQIGRRLIPGSACEDVMRYLRSRGLASCSGIQALRRERYYDEGQMVGEFPAMALPFHSVAGELVTYHITYLLDGKKAPVTSPRKLLTPLSKMDGGCLRLTKTHAHIGLSEGVETALAVMADFGLPCWAATSAGMMEKFLPPSGVESVTIFADHDKNFTGQKAAYILAHRLHANGYAVSIQIPHEAGDFADHRRVRA